MSPIAIVAKLTAAEGKRDEAIAVLSRLVDAAENEPDTLEYVLLADQGDRNLIWFYELYADQAGLDAHMASPTMVEVLGSMRGLLAGPADLRQMEVVRRMGAQV
jgi:quinol monooxygenase YgiN